MVVLSTVSQLSSSCCYPRHVLTPPSDMLAVMVCMLCQETAVNIGYACSLLRTDMALYRVSADVQAVVELEDAGKVQEVGSLHASGLALKGVSTQATHPVNTICQPRCSCNSFRRLRRGVTKCAGSCVETKPSAALCSCGMLPRAMTHAAAEDMLAGARISPQPERHVRLG